MTKEEHNKVLNDLKNCASDADKMALILQLETDYTGVLNERDIATTTATKATEECNKYAKLNNELWLANSVQEKIGQATQTAQQTTEENTPPSKRTYEDLETKM